MKKKYWHELSDDEIKAIPGNTKCSTLRKRYKQPDWCNYPEAIDALGCWSLVGDNRTKISREFCKNCDCSKDYVKSIPPKPIDWSEDMDKSIEECGL